MITKNKLLTILLLGYIIYVIIYIICIERSDSYEANKQ